MMEQVRLQEQSQQYSNFVNKFKPKLTTDDCYTPQHVYNAIRDVVIKQYGLQSARVVRPFWNGADYTRDDYSGNCVVIDNPPFSIISKIVKWYTDRCIKFFLFAPHLTLFSAAKDDETITRIVASCSIRYENGAIVNTDFLTNLQPGTFARTFPQINKAVAEAQKQKKSQKIQELPKYKYDHVITSATLGMIAQRDIEFSIPNDEAYFLRSLASQREKGKTIFGAGCLVSDRVWEQFDEARRQADEARRQAWVLDSAEREIIERLNTGRK